MVLELHIKILKSLKVDSRSRLFVDIFMLAIFHSYGLPLKWYKPSDVVEWVFENFETINSNAVTLQEIESQSCGQYALMYLKMKARGKSMHDFISLFKKSDFMYNDHLVGEMVKLLLGWRVRNLKRMSA